MKTLKTAYVAQKIAMTRSRERSGSCMCARRRVRRPETRTSNLSGDAVDPDLRRPRRYLTAAAVGQTRKQRELVVLRA
jgi:hypothetical protein